MFEVDAIKFSLCSSRVFVSVPVSCHRSRKAFRLKTQCEGEAGLHRHLELDMSLLGSRDTFYRSQIPSPLCWRRGTSSRAPYVRQLNIGRRISVRKDLRFVDEVWPLLEIFEHVQSTANRLFALTSSASSSEFGGLMASLW